ncbi:MAG TPA: FtsX-like permease family protein [Acidimicrobiia bacterium]
MRLVPYIDLVVRRVWAKRGILVGSLLGATLVIALLVIVPLYEASVQAVDLVFTVRGAPASQVDLVALETTSSYSAATAASNRDLVADTQARSLAEWYPSIIERTQSRELVVIPIGGSEDWLGSAEEWRGEIARLEADGTPPEEFPQAPYPTPPQEPLQVRLLTSPFMEEAVTVVSGEFPPTSSSPASGGDPLRIAIGSDVSRLGALDVGDRFVLKPFLGQRETFEVVEIAGIVEPVDPGAKIWGIDDPSRMIYVDQATFDAWTTQIPITPTEDPWLRPFRGLVQTSATQRFVLELAPDELDLEELAAIRGAVNSFRAETAQATGGAMATSSGLTSLLDAFGVRSVVVGAPILAILALVVGGALYFLVYTAALTLEREGPEMALLRTRGASTWQTVGIHLAQSLLIAGVAGAAAPYVARLMVGLTGRIPPLSELTGGEPLRVAQLQSVVPWVLGGAVTTFVAMGLAIIPFARRRVLELRSLAARPTGTSVWQRYNLDLFAIALSLVILVQLAQRGFINTSGDEVALDPVAVVFPVLLLFTGALVLLRVLPWVLRLVGWLMTKRRAMPLALPGWHLGRNPIPYGRLALLVWLTTGFGAFALTYANTLEGSFTDRAAFAAGADLRIVAPGAGFLAVPDGDAGTGVLRTSGGPRRAQSRPAEGIAIRPDEFSEVVVWRSDFGVDPSSVFSPLRPDGDPPDQGVTLAADATAIRLDGIVVPSTVLAEVELSTALQDRTVRWMAKVFDADGKVWTMQADEDLVTTEWRTVAIDLGEGRPAYPSPPVPPLTIHAIWVERVNPTDGNVTNGEQVVVSSIEVVTPAGRADLRADLYGELQPSEGMSIREDQTAMTARDARFRELPEGQEPPTAEELAASPLAREGQADVWVFPVRGRIGATVPQLRMPPVPVRVLLDAEAAANAGLEVGESAAFSVEGTVFDAELAGLVGPVPTVTDRRFQGTMVFDIDAMNMLLNGEATWSYNTTPRRVTAPQELWVRTDDADAAARRVSGQLPPSESPDEVITIAGAEAQFSSRPVQVGLVAILFVGAATSIALALFGVTGYVLLAVARRAREMGVLRALGLGRSSVAATFAVEQLVVLGLGAVIGIAGGIALMKAMLPFLQLGETAEDIVPPIILSIDWIVLLGYVAFVGALLIVSVVWATRRVSVRRMSEVLREVER